VSTEEVAFISNGVELPRVAVYNVEMPQSFTLICAGGEESRDLEIIVGHDELPRPVPNGVHFTTEGLTIGIREFDNVIEVSVTVENFTNRLGIGCTFQGPQSLSLATYILTSGILNF